MEVVSIHAPVQGATGRVFRIGPVIDVSIHAPVQGATPLAKIFDRGLTFQSTLLYKERQSVVLVGLSYLQVSIHAPVQGATWRQHLSS